MNKGEVDGRDESLRQGMKWNYPIAIDSRNE